MLFGYSLDLYFACAIGVFVLHVENNTGKKKIFEILGFFFPKYKDSALCKLGEALLFTIIGSLVVTIITVPTNYQQALISGLGFSGVLTKIKSGSWNGYQ